MNNSKKFFILIIFLTGFLFGLGLLTVSKFFFTGAPLYADTNSTNAENVANPDDDNYFKFFPMFKEAFNILKREYYDKNMVVSKKLIYGAVKGMMESVDDPYTTFMDPTVSKEFSIDMTASFGGLGIQIDIRDNWLTIISPIEDTPAWKAGLKSGDKIVEIEGKSTKGISVKEAVDKMRGKPGTSITITIVREGIKDPFQVTMKREEIKLKRVKSDIIESHNKKIGYIKVDEFSITTAEELKDQLTGTLNKKPDGLIIDLRNNPGGYLNIVVSCVNYFQKEGLIVYTRGRLAENNTDFRASAGNGFVPVDLPVVVMINQGSASASEIFAGAMQDTGRAVLIGMKSYGKGSVQKTFTFPDDGSLIKYTVAKYFTPSGRSIDKVGLTPNVEEKMWYETLADDEKNSLIKIQNTNFIKEFLAENTNYDSQKLSNFQKSLEEKNYKIGTKSLKWLIKMKTTENSLPEIYDAEFDNQLDKALEVLEHYKDYKKPLTNFNEAK